MPFALVTIGIVLFVTGFQNTYQALGKQLKSDFTGSGNFFYWIVAIGAVGSIGYIPAWKGPSRAFLVLILFAMFLSNRGFFAKLTGILPNTGDALTGGGSTAASSGGSLLGGSGSSGIDIGSIGGSTDNTGISGGAGGDF